MNAAIRGGKGDDSAELNALSHCATINQKLQNIEDLVCTITTAISTSKAETEKRFENLEKSYAEVAKQNAESAKTTMEMNDSTSKFFAQQMQISQTELRKNNAVL